jgi:anti-sigma B factor antagonist
MDCLIRSTIRGDVVVVDVSGEVDVDGAADLRQALVHAVTSGFVDLEVDLQGVTFIDCTALGVLVAAVRAVREHQGRLQLVVSDRAVLRLLRISSLHRVMSVRDTSHLPHIPRQRTTSPI